jgi:hypothetical protein
MRIDDNERREVAKKLRNLDVRKYDAYHLINPYDVETALGLEPDDEYWFTADSVYRLADLIDRPIANEMRECNDIEERRKIANRLRGLDSKIGDRDTLSTAVDELRMAVCGNAAISPVEYSVRNLVGFALELADLIEGNQYGGTCRNVYPNNEDHHCDNGFRCSACGDTVEDCENYRVSGTWSYCQKCRAKVVG